MCEKKDCLWTEKITKYKDYIKRHILSTYQHTVVKNSNYPNQKIVISLLALLLDSMILEAFLEQDNSVTL